ncbi:dockerin type I domain-containing protein [Blastopirellula sp. J2-11]|uniref:dockerin type I domain-containing protein n=1 Tax=Blastopirellula sp. J2-11 TaxID=2943192 RepID=UPI0021C71BD7|nr:dockerin type I domain-containing protein [Blastopirellula sp. J2-11]UUO06827.1 dockerin type I domain-containing protein [Blastopirellula sp. J2-11]
MWRPQGGNPLRVRRIHVRRGASIESLEVRAMLAADAFLDPNFAPADDIDTPRSPAANFGPRQFELEGEQVDPAPVLLHFSVVTDPTEFSDADHGSVEQLPESMLRTHEWDRYFVEVWVESGESVDDMSVDLNYQTEIATPRNVTFGPAFAGGQFSVDDELGELRNLTAHAQPPTAGAGPAEGLVLFARIEFGADLNRDNVELDFETGTVGPHSLELDMVRSTAMTSEGNALEVHSAETPEFGLVPVIYDLNDDQSINLIDLSMMIRTLGHTASEPNGEATWYADVNKDYVVSLIDMSYMIRNLGKNWGSEEIQFPANYPEAWITETTVGGEEGPGGGTDPGDEGDPGDGGQNDPPLRFVPIDVGGNRLAPDPAMLLALQALLQVEFIFPVGFDFTLLQGNVSYSDGDNDGDKETLLQIEVDDQLFETEIEIEIMTELIDSDELWSDWSGAVSSYFGEVVAGLKDLFLNDEE